MNTNQTRADQEVFSKDFVQNMLNKIFKSPLFSKSKILQRFLEYVIEETLDGRSMSIKEYSIALDVLGKPAGFLTSLNGVVRIHAQRLRNALEVYYNEDGIEDDLIITMPKGRYIPIFTKRGVNSGPKWNMKFTLNKKEQKIDILNVSWMIPPSYIHYSPILNIRS